MGFVDLQFLALLASCMFKDTKKDEELIIAGFDPGVGFLILRCRGDGRFGGGFDLRPFGGAVG
jgi:hypothetical protein